MAMQNFALNAGRINKYAGQILSHAVPQEILGRAGRQVRMPRNQSDTYVARRWLPYGGTTTDATRSTASSRWQRHRPRDGDCEPAPDR
jgi:hypothetical protein